MSVNPMQKVARSGRIPKPRLVWKEGWACALPALAGVGAFFVNPGGYVLNSPYTFWLKFSLDGAILLCVGMFSSQWMFAWKFKRLRFRLARSGDCICTGCGYDLHVASDTGTCPECAYPYRRVETILAWKAWQDGSFFNPRARTRLGIKRKEFFILSLVLVGAFFLLTGPSRMESSRASDAYFAAVDALTQAEVRRVSTLNPANGATSDQKVAAEAAVNAARQARDDADDRHSKAVESYSSVTEGSLLLIAVVGLGVIFWRNWRLQTRDRAKQQSLHSP